MIQFKKTVALILNLIYYYSIDKYPHKHPTKPRTNVFILFYYVISMPNRNHTSHYIVIIGYHYPVVKLQTNLTHNSFLMFN